MITRIVIQLGFTRHLIILVIVTNTLKFNKLIHYNDIPKHQISNLFGKKKSQQHKKQELNPVLSVEEYFFPVELLLNIFLSCEKSCKL